MRESVRKAWVPVNAPWEGVCNHLYLDVLGLVTTGMGNLVDPSGTVLDLPFVRSDGSPATRHEIAGEWVAIKARQDMKLRGGGAFKKLCKLHLTPEGIEQVVTRKLLQMETFLKNRFPQFEDWPADAQLAVLSHSWACGPAFRFPKMEAALRAFDFMGTSEHCHMEDSQNPGLRPRNKANVVMFQNAAMVMEDGSDREVLHYPAVLTDGVPFTADMHRTISPQNRPAAVDTVERKKR